MRIDIELLACAVYHETKALEYGENFIRYGGETTELGADALKQAVKHTNFANAIRVKVATKESIKKYAQQAPFMGIVCKHCKKPFLVWNTEFEGLDGEDENIPEYLDEGHTREMIRSEVAGDYNKWCSCSNSNNSDNPVETNTEGTE